MSNTILGIDMGTNSLGWALIDLENYRVIDAGVRIFPEGVDRDQKGGELSKNETRRTKRGQRRQITRRARRKKRMCAFLRMMDLVPAPDTTEWEELLKTDPYLLRKKALDESLTRYELGRVFLHLCQRRGFKSNRKSGAEQKKEASKMLMEISALEANIQKAECRTLGEFLAGFRGDELQKVRGWHTRREMYENELNCIWQTQQRFHPEILTEEIFPIIHKIIFFQRDMYWKRSVLGKCELEPKEYRCPRADRTAQKFRMYQEINNLRLLDTQTGEERPLTEEERKTLADKLMQTDNLTIEQIRKLLSLPDYCQFNLERSKRASLYGMVTDKALSNKKLFGKRWYEMPDEQKDEIVALLLNEKVDDAVARQKAVNEWGLSEEASNGLLDLNFPEGYARLSRMAMIKMMPFMEQGLPIMTTDDQPSVMSQAGYLRPDQRPLQIHAELPEPPEMPNPVVRQALIEFRKLMNAILRTHGKPDHIHIELAREVKGTASEREELLIKNRERERERQRIKEEILKEGHAPNREAVNRFLLWKEQNYICVYSGAPISMAQLFGGEVDVDHILPYSRSLDNSLMNKVVCFRSANADKGDRTPYEWMAEQNPERWEKILQYSRDLLYGKRRKFLQKNVELDNFINRQLTDTQYISRELANYVKCLDVDVLCTKGQLTAELRHSWGLNTILGHEGTSIKNRDDHRHHAVDAIVIALTDRSRLQQLARTRRKNLPDLSWPEPWQGFRQEVEGRIRAIHVSHRVQRKIHGALHKETLYGPTQQPGVFSYRKPLKDLTPKMIKNIRDDTIRVIVQERLRQHGVAEGEKIPASVWKEPLLMPSGVPIKKVRLAKKDQTIEAIRGGKAFVKPGKNHHVCLFEWQDDQGLTVRDAVFVTMLEAVRRIKYNEPIIRRVHSEKPEAKFLFTLSKNEMVLIDENGKEELYVYDTAAGTTKQMTFIHHTYSGKVEKPPHVITKYPKTLKARKVTVDLLGKIRDAHD